MDCPSCNHVITPTESPDGSLSFACKRCGWGHEQLIGSEAVPEPEPINWGRFLMYWTGAIIVIVAPYVGIRLGLARLIEQDSELVKQMEPERFLVLLNLNYWWVMLVCVAIAALVTPKVDRDDLGWGGGLMDDPFSFSDDLNRMKLGINIVLLPGKIVYIALRNTALIVVSNFR